MTFDVEPDAPDDIELEAENLHEYLVNNRGYDTEDVLATAHDDGTLTLRIAPHIGSGELLLERLEQSRRELVAHRNNIESAKNGDKRNVHVQGIDDGLQAIDKALGKFDE